MEFASIVPIAAGAASAYGAYGYYKRGDETGMWWLIALAVVCVFMLRGLV